MIKRLEITVWDAAKARDAAAFLALVDENAVMVCGGYRCTGKEYAEIIREFDCRSFELSGFEEVARSDDMVQVHYVLKMEAQREENRDLAGVFHITSTWKKKESGWALVFNMDSRIG